MATLATNACHQRAAAVACRRRSAGSQQPLPPALLSFRPICICDAHPECFLTRLRRGFCVGTCWTCGCRLISARRCPQLVRRIAPQVWQSFPYTHPPDSSFKKRGSPLQVVPVIVLPPVRSPCAVRRLVCWCPKTKTRQGIDPSIGGCDRHGARRRGAATICHSRCHRSSSTCPPSLRRCGLLTFKNDMKHNDSFIIRHWYRSFETAPCPTARPGGLETSKSPCVRLTLQAEHAFGRQHMCLRCKAPMSARQCRGRQFCSRSVGRLGSIFWLFESPILTPHTSSGGGEPAGAGHRGVLPVADHPGTGVPQLMPPASATFTSRSSG